MDRSEGQWDLICRGDSTPCHQYISNGNRFVHYPARDQCCYCCSEADGCGMLKPNWLANATFIGTTTFNGSPAYEWDQKGGSDNFYYEFPFGDPSYRYPLGIKEPAETFTFTSYESTVDNSMLKLPSTCDISHTCSWLNMCEQARNSGETFPRK